ncbi:MAG TPA: ABC transporter permease [Puia sp.]|nr:ABC transporter permease [Puia sp.]
MLFNYLKVAFRHLWKNKGFSFINIAGLALGLGAAMLILLWVRDERRMDASFPNKDRLYRVYMRETVNGVVSGGQNTPGLMAQELKRKIPQIEAASDLNWTMPATFAVGEKIITAPVNFADSDFFKLFGEPLLVGDAATALTSPLSIAISRKLAVTFFGSPAAALGKTVRYDNRKDFTVTAVYENQGADVSDHYDCLINWHAFMQDNDWLNRWGNNGPSCFILLRPGTDPAVVRKAVKHFLEAYIPSGPNDKREVDILRYADYYLHGDLTSGYPAGGRIEYVRLFTTVAFFVLFIACINFMNLTTGRSVRRAREIGVRKVMGAVRLRLIAQFVGEAMLIALLSMVLALALVSIVLPAFNGFTGKQVSLPFGSAGFWMALGALTVVTGVLSGSYPALYLSSFRPVVVLKGSLGMVKTSLFRKGLVVFQFVLSIILITGALIVARQIDYIRHKDVGYARENLLYLPMNGNLTTHYDAFREAALALPGISGVTGMSGVPTNLDNWSADLEWDGKDPNYVPHVTNAAIGYDFIRTMKLQLAAGRDFYKDIRADSNSYVVNESAAALMGYKQPIGRRMSFWGRKGTIIGVVRDFHFQSFHDAIRPLILRPGLPDDLETMLVRVRPGETQAALDGLARLCKTMNPAFPFTFQWADLEYAKLYRSEQITGTLSTIFALLAIVISCLGLLGLSIFTVEQRTKEIGIRKVLGARAGLLFVLLSREFLLLIVIAFGIATPVAWWAMGRWLSGYVYQAPIGAGIFLVSGVAALVTALATVSYQTWRAVRANPVKALRSE